MMSRVIIALFALGWVGASGLVRAEQVEMADHCKASCGCAPCGCSSVPCNAFGDSPIAVNATPATVQQAQESAIAK